MTHQPTDETRAQVFALSSFGVTQEDIGGFIGISDDSLRKFYAPEIARAKVERNAEVAAFLFRSANGSTIKEGASYSDCLKAAMFWLKTRAQWKETNVVEGTGPNGEHLHKVGIDPTRLSDAALAELIGAMNETNETDTS